MKQLSKFAFFAFLVATLFTQCTPRTDQGSTGNHDSDSVVVDTTATTDSVIPDTDMIITHEGEIGLVVPMETAPLLFKDNGTKPLRMAASFSSAVNMVMPTSHSIYIDRCDDIYKNVTARNELAKYCKDNKITDAYIYHWSDMVSTSSNFTAVGDFLQLLQRNGVSKRIPVLGSGNTTNTDKFYRSQTDSTRRFNGIQLELEWWNNSSTRPTATFTEYVNVLYTINNYCKSKSPQLYTTIYIGWFKQLDGNTDSSAARKLWQLCDWIDIHDYQNNIVSYTYGSSRYEGLAKGAWSLNKIGVCNVIFSSEQKSLGADNDFQGNYLKAKGYAGVDQVFVNNFNSYASVRVKTSLRIQKTKWFTYRYNKVLIPPIK